MKKNIIIITTLVLFILTGCEKKVEEYSKNFFYMDTYINVKLYDVNETEANEAFDEIDKIYEKYELMTNPYDEKSEVYKINTSKDKKIKISDDLLDILTMGNKWYDETDGQFNINMGKVIKAWKKAREEGKLPKKLDYKISKLKIKDNYIVNDNVNIDLGAIVKGYATEKIGDKLEELNISNYLVNAGGNVLLGKHPVKKYYTVGIENPENKGEIYNTVIGTNISVVTSGGYERFYELDGKKYHHIIDPKTKYPAENMLSCTVIAKSSALADILSTSLFLLSPDDAINLIEQIDGAEAILYVSKDNIIRSSGFSKYEQK